MWCMYPVSIGAGLLIAFAFAGTSADRAADEAGFAIANMLHSHNAAFDASKLAGFPVGEVQADLPPPLRSARAWKSAIVSDDGGSYLLTWLSDPLAGASEKQRFKSALSKLEAPDARRNFPAAAFAGVFRESDGTSGFIGTTMVPLPSAGIRTGSPAVGSRIP